MCNEIVYDMNMWDRLFVYRDSQTDTTRLDCDRNETYTQTTELVISCQTEWPDSHSDIPPFKNNQFIITTPQININSPQ